MSQDHSPMAQSRQGVAPTRAQRQAHDRSVFHKLLAQHKSIRRAVETLPDGIHALTTARDPALVALLHEHAQAMERRLHEGFGLRPWDPAFAELFAQKDKVRLQLTLTDAGVEVTETSEDPNVARLIQAHGAVVSLFVKEGARVAAQENPLPQGYRRVLS